MRKVIDSMTSGEVLAAAMDHLANWEHADAVACVALLLDRLEQGQFPYVLRQDTIPGLGLWSIEADARDQAKPSDYSLDAFGADDERTLRHEESNKPHSNS